MFKTVGISVAQDEYGNEVRFLGRYKAGLRSINGESFEIGLNKDDLTIELMSGEVYRITDKGDRQKVRSTDAMPVLEIVRAGLLELSEKDVIIPK